MAHVNSEICIFDFVTEQNHTTVKCSGEECACGEAKLARRDCMSRWWLWMEHCICMFFSLVLALRTQYSLERSSNSILEIRQTPCQYSGDHFGCESGIGYSDCRRTVCNQTDEHLWYLMYQFCRCHFLWSRPCLHELHSE